MLDGLQHNLYEKQEKRSDSDVRSQETTRSEQHGPRLTKVCSECGEEKPLSEFHFAGRGRRRSDCASCRKLVLSKGHPVYNPRSNGISRLAAQIAGSARRLYLLPREERLKIRSVATQMYENGQDFATAQSREATDKRGFVYIIRNPAWPAHVKIGRAFDPEARLNGYQTGCPERDYKLEYAVYFEDCHAAEKLIHDTLADYRAQGEWFRILPSTAEHVLNEIGGYI